MPYRIAGLTLDQVGLVNRRTSRRNAYVLPPSSGAGDDEPSSSSEPSLFQADFFAYPLRMTPRLLRSTPPIAYWSDTRVTRVPNAGSITACRYPGRAVTAVGRYRRVAAGTAG